MGRPLRRRGSGVGAAADAGNVFWNQGFYADPCAPRIDTAHTHGTGCTLASAIATGLAAGLPLPDSVARAIRFVRLALERAPGLGHGHGPMGQQFVTEFQCPA